MKKNAATYRRSSKDRNDVSPAAQLRKLQELSLARGLSIVADFVDVELSGSDEDRPDFLKLLATIKNRNRGWDHLLVYDTSRIARGRYLAQAFKHQAKRCGVTIHYATLPADLDPIAEVILESSFEAMDEVWSMMSRTKGLLGMRENVARGFRAGGRAPLGYELEHQATGVIREGKPVMKSRLVLAANSNAVRTYLIGRTRGIPRVRLSHDLKLDRSPSTLVCMEWNALTYAGHTTWNVHAEPGSGTKRRPRSEWVIQRNTHPALITDAQAESLLSALTTSRMGEAVSRAKASMSPYLLTGILTTSDGRHWTGKNGRHYKLRASDRGPGKLVNIETVDRAVLARIAEDMRSEQFLEELLAASRAAGMLADPSKPIRDRIAKLEREKLKAAELALSAEDSATFVSLVQARSSQIEALRRELEAVDMDSDLLRQVRELTPGTLRELLLELGGPSEALQTMVDRVILDPDLSCRLHYRAAGGLSVASPRGHGGSAPVLSVPVLLRHRA